jgi:type II secretory pathway predicted ATPase ExeA/septal ring-binding cell division protein DamX
MKDSENNETGVAPFREHCNTARFFTGGGRGAVLDDIKAAFADHVDIVTLMGDEGSGKTMLCKMLQEQLGKPYRPVFLPEVVGSFEDLARITAQECDFDFPAETTRADAMKIFLDLVDTLRERGETLLLISDQAENMYLATLERIRRMLDDVNSNGGGLQLLFSGWKSLRANLEQLALCDFEETREKQFFLSPLDDDDTWEYLNFCVQDSQEETAQEVFSKEAAAKIASMARGNLRRINAYAAESLSSSSADTSFCVLLDHVNDDGTREKLLPKSISFFEQLPFPKKYLFAGGAVCFIILLLLFAGNDDSSNEIQVGETEVVTSVVVPETLPEAVEVEKTEVFVGKVEKDTKAQPQAPETSPVVSKPIIEKTVGTVSGAVAIAPIEIKEKKETEGTVPILAEQNKIAVGKTKRIVMQPEKAAPVKIAPIPVAPAQAPRSNDPLASLKAGGNKWLTGQMDTHFSIQLMALQSEHAEENLRRIIAKPEYQQVLDKMVMLKRPSDPPVVLVFYGLYPSMTAARNARNTMPIFLRDRHPYPVSVRGAVEKGRVE